jgi:D-amino-acid dehydrogenase
VTCGAVAVAGGAWTAAVGEWLGTRLPVGPTKGQIVHLGVGAETGEWPIVQPLLTHYLVPWPGSRVACGGTFEAAAGFSVSVTAAGLHELLRECLTVAPGLNVATYLETRVGLRPTSADDRAIVGRLPGWGNAWVATGHGANGLLQGPFSARVLAHAMAGEALPADEAPLPDSFDPGRFA